ncbi:MAG: CRISPR-associated endoribonuclease Cas6, partial [Selenomonadaceae bacterium]|nr:CRISPR-associated endoribonuclease Cas6 [Selenomonadaceae bacterium]
MIGAIVYELQAENSTCLPIINGRFMHAAFFKILNDVSPTFGTFVHNEFNLKPFTVSFLEPVEKIPSRGDLWIVRRGDKF